MMYIETREQYITFTRYVEKGEIKVHFLDIRRINANDSTANNLYQYWQDVADILVLIRKITLDVSRLLRGDARQKQPTPSENSTRSMNVPPALSEAEAVKFAKRS